MVRRTAVVGAVSAMLAVAGCGSDATGERASAPVPPESRVLARDAHLHAGAHGVRLLSLGRLGRLLISCDDDGGASAAFVGGRMLASADAVVQSGDQAAEGVIEPGIRFRPAFARSARVEHWQIGEFAEAHAAVVTMTLAMRSVDSPPNSCAISAQVTVSTPAAGTLTR